MKFDCANCKYHKEFDVKPGMSGHACMYMSDATAWECAMEKTDGDMHLGETKGQVQDNLRS